MAEENPNQYAKALEIVNRYYQRIVEEMAGEICEREDSIVDGGFGWMEIEDRYANKFFNISQIYCNLKKFAGAENDEDEAAAAPAPAPGIEAARLQVDERICPTDEVRGAVESWLEENPEAMLWNLRVHPRASGDSTCLFFYSTP